MGICSWGVTSPVHITECRRSRLVGGINWGAWDPITSQEVEIELWGEKFRFWGVDGRVREGIYWVYVNW